MEYIMIAVERRNKIKEILLETKSVSVSEIASLCNVTLETVRRDFEALEADGFLERVHGGAILRRRAKMNVDFNTLSTLLVENKQVIAHKAAEFIIPGDCIFVDHSSTALRLLDEIPNLDTIELNVLTNSLGVISKLINYPNITTTAVGGVINCRSHGLFGSVTTSFFSEYHLDKAFISCRSLHMEKGLCDANEQEADIHKAAIRNSTSVYLIMDHTKLDRTNFSRISNWPIPNLAALITDKPLSAAWREFLDSRMIPYYDGDLAAAHDDETE